MCDGSQSPCQILRVVRLHDDRGLRQISVPRDRLQRTVGSVIQLDGLVQPVRKVRGRLIQLREPVQIIVVRIIHRDSDLRRAN